MGTFLTAAACIWFSLAMLFVLALAQAASRSVPFRFRRRGTRRTHGLSRPVKSRLRTVKPKSNQLQLDV